MQSRFQFAVSKYAADERSAELRGRSKTRTEALLTALHRSKRKPVIVVITMMRDGMQELSSDSR